MCFLACVFLGVCVFVCFLERGPAVEDCNDAVGSCGDLSGFVCFSVFWWLACLFVWFKIVSWSPAGLPASC